MKLNRPTTVFIPGTSNPIYIKAIKSFGANVMIAGNNAGEAQLPQQILLQRRVPIVFEQGSLAFVNAHRLLVELASGAALSLVYVNHPIIRDYDSILVIVCGGVNISHFNLEESV